MTRAEQQVAAILAELREQAARNQEVGYPDAVVHLQAAEAAVHAAAGLNRATTERTAPAGSPGTEHAA